ncbi:AAA domain-containing protein [Polluticoccus soli]|uniref:AAA domain-containing protein n=1 Tax=Polluticoccus soli TaxID=3034150 RepID=UPI0023E1D080|nr:AAA domain-containing protein [Flavipsychrobacter sp. JY13-12]
MKLTKSFAGLLKQKLAIGDSRSILLNANPGRLVSRLPLSDLNVIKNGLGKQFLDTLTSQRTFTFNVAINFTNRKEEDAGKLARIGKRLSSIKFDYDDYLKEHGVETFGFGFPILVRQHPRDPAKVIAAPVFIFPLDIKQSFDKPNEWVISRDSDSEIRVNEVLTSFMENEEHLKLPVISEEMLEDGIMDPAEIDSFCSELLSKFLNKSAEAIPPNQDKKLEPFPEKIKNGRNDVPTKLLWNGVFGIYKSQKQNLIKEVDLLLSDYDNIMSEIESEFTWDNSHSPMRTDPSQNGVLRSLSDSRNIVIQGPPGTGKSQTLTAIVSSALANNKKVLVVCEKRTALEVLKNNLEKLIPESKKAIALIEDVSRDRATIVETVRGRTASYLASKHHLQQILNENISSFEEKASTIDRQYSALKQPVWKNLQWNHMVGQWLKPRRTEQDKFKLYNLQRIFQQDRTADNEYHNLLRVIEEAARLFGKTKPTLTQLSATVKLPLDLSKAYHHEVVHSLKEAAYKLSDLANKIEKLKAEIKATTTDQVNELANATLTQIDKLSTILDSARSADADIFNLPFKARILSIFSKKWKQLIEMSSAAKSTRQSLTSYWKDLFNEPFSTDLLGGKKSLVLVKQPAIAEARYNECINDQGSKKLNPAHKEVINQIHQELADLLGILNRLFSNLPNSKNLNALQSMDLLQKELIGYVTNLLKLDEEIGFYISWVGFERKLNAFETSWIKALHDHNPDEWVRTIEDAWLYRKLLEHDTDDKFPTDDSTLRVLKDLGMKIQKHQEQLISKNIDDWFVAGQQRVKQLNLTVNQLYNLRGSKGNTRNSLRKIVQSDLTAFTDFFPVLMLNPSTCSSLLPLQREFFDLVIFDEASQLRIEDTFTALIRGKQVIVSGDSQQMPPSNYFGSSAQFVDDDSDTDDETEEDDSSALLDEASKGMATKESLLEFAIDADYKETYLDMHYRSKHPDLIEFSNACFYNSRLVPMPERSSEKPISYIHVNGMYEQNKNTKEAEEIIRILRDEIDPQYSVGIATFNLTQRNHILTMIGDERLNDKDFHIKMVKLEENGFFVKNLENIQGDERDIILISTTFGVKPDGKFIMNFGPIIKQNGHRLLNVIITRAKVKVYLLTSIPEAKISEYRDRLESYRKVDGRTGLMAYLDYCKAVSDGDNLEKNNILDYIRSKVSLGQANFSSTSTGLTESPFEEEVYSWLADAIGPERVLLQYKCGGFRIDMVVLPKSPESKTLLAIECDGAAYHSDQLSWHYDIYRQEQLEQEGFVFHRIWSTNWWRKPEKEFQNLLEIVNRYS